MLGQSDRIARSGMASASNHNVIIFVISSRYWGWRFVSIFNWTCRFIVSSDRAGWLVSMACGVNFCLLSNEVMILRRWVIQNGINVGLFKI